MATIVFGALAGDWNDDTKWVGGVKPTAADDAQLTVLSADCNIDAAAVCRSLDCTGFTGILSHASATILSIGDASGGSLTLVSGMTYTKSNSTTSAISFLSTTTGNIITTAGFSLGNLIFGSGAGGYWTLGDALTSAGTITLTRGTLDDGGFNVTFSSFASNSGQTRVLTMSATWTGTSTTPWNTGTASGLTINPGASTISCTNGGSSQTAFVAADGQIFNNITVGGSGGTGRFLFNNSNTFNVLTLPIKKSVRFTSGKTVTVSSFVATGTPGNIITIDSTSAGSPATLSKSSGIVNCNYLSLKDSAAIGGATWNAGANSINVSGNSGWLFSSAAISLVRPPSRMLVGVGR